MDLKNKGLTKKMDKKISATVNRHVHDALKHNGILIEDKTYKYCVPQYIPNYFHSE